GILLSAGRGTRFDPAGVQDKLLQRLPDGDAVAVAAARTLHAVLPEVVAVVRPGADRAAAALKEAGCRITICPDADAGMAASLVHALSQTPHADGWIVALADMPFVAPATVSALMQAIRQGADIAAPVHAGRRGNPVAFGRRHLTELLQLQGDGGARGLLRRHPVQLVEVDDPGIHRDIDTPADLAAQHGSPAATPPQ
ncbi:nucleotidyltransferase family protein, partial [Oxalobacteraceae bacterium OM1]